MNFVIALSVIPDGFDTFLSVTDKFFKMTILLPEKITLTAEEWVSIFLNETTDWDISCAIIFNHNSKFLFNFWTALFQSLNTKILMSTAYHSQADEQSEWINQTFKIALQYYLMKNSDTDWSAFLSHLRVLLNSSSNSTEISAYKILYSFNINDLLSLTTGMFRDFIKNCKIHWLEVKKVIVFINTAVKIIYNTKHHSLQLQKKETAFLKLHDEYKLLSTQNRKLSQQHAESFKIIRKIKNLVYELKLSSQWKVHSVISITHLELKS